MRLQRNFYEVLGVPRTASQQEIKKKYHELARQFHPDRAQDKELAQRLFVQINQAYQTLIDPDKRTRYDNGLFTGNGVAPAGAKHTTQPTNATPEQVKRWMNEANDAYLRGDREVALKLCQRVLRADHVNGDAYQLMGDMYADRGQRQEALTAYRTASSLQPANLMLQNKIKRIEALASKQPAEQAAAAPSASGRPAPQAAPAGASKTNRPGAMPKHSFFGRLMEKVRPG
ncbi:MAG TPA: DnaJ domain-containing protein [Capsulimonadaceae bacterium]|nr:DnaJ domain-containing protein [Capsulimonadaceae bacterium]